MRKRELHGERDNARNNVAGVENARHENARNAVVWNTACCICLSIAEQECMSRQEEHQISPPTVFLWAINAR